MRQLTVLWALRIFGPISGRELLRRTRLTRDTVAINMQVHVDDGHAVEVRPGVWDITDAGRERLEPRPAPVPVASKPLSQRDWRLRWRGRR